MIISVIKLTVFFLIFSTYIYCIDIEVLPQKVSVGDVFVIKVFKKDDVKLSIGKSNFPTFLSDDGKFRRVILGVPSWWDSGNYDIFVDGKNTDVSIEIIKKEFPTQEIKVAPEKIVENEKTKVQREIISERILTKTKYKMWEGRFIMPVEGKITSEFGVRRKVNDKARGYHRGIDISAPLGSIIKASNAGKVVLVGEFILPGKVVIINHGQGIVSTYYHLSEILVQEDELVKKGQPIGKVGSTGVATGSHLHWGMYIFGVDVNPLNFVNNIYE